MNKPSKEAIEADPIGHAIDLILALPELKVSLMRPIIQSAFEKAMAAQPDGMMSGGVQKMTAQPQRSEPSDPIQVGGRCTCPKCGDDYSMAYIHQCAASSEPQEWTDKQLHELVMDLRVATGYPENIHRQFFDLIKPWFDAHESALADEREVNRTAIELACGVLREEHKKELAAEREKVKPLVEALERVVELYLHLTNLKDLLAKVKDGNLATTKENEGNDGNIG